MRALVTAIVLLCAGHGFAANEPARQVQSPREMLQIMQIDASFLRFFQDDTPDDGESEALEKLLFRIPSFSQVHLDRWSKEIDDISAVVRDPDSWRFDMHIVSGELLELQEVAVLPEAVTRLGFRQYYKATIRHQDTDCEIHVRTIPKKWLPIGKTRPLGQHVTAQALLLKRSRGRNGAPSLVFAASRLNWHPQEVAPEFGISRDHVLLSQLGLDIDRLQDLVQKAPIVHSDRECFYQALAAVRHTEPELLSRLGKKTFQISRLIQNPETATGELFTLSGLARRAIRIQVSDADIRERFGINHYYEIEVFVPLERNVRFVDPNQPDDQEGKVFTDYPFVICVPELPEDMEEGDDIREPVTFSGFFLKQWAYRTTFMSGNQARTDKPRLQQSPLFVGPTVTLQGPGVPQDSQLSLIIASLFTASLACVWIVLWRASINDNRLTKRLFKKHDPAGSFDTIGELDANNDNTV